MSVKKKLGSKLASSVRQVKSQRDLNPAPAPDKTAPAAKKPVPQPPAPSAPAKPVTRPAERPQPVAAPVSSSDTLHPRRVWPD